MKKILSFIFLILLLASSAFGQVFGSAYSTTPPTLSSATIGTNGTTWTFVFNEAVRDGAGGWGGWAVTMSSAGAITLTYASGTGTSTLVYSGSPTVNSGETVSVGLNYTQPTHGIEDLLANDLASLTGHAVTNNSTQGIACAKTDNFNRTENPLSDSGAWITPTFTNIYTLYTTGTVVQGTHSSYINMAYRNDCSWSPNQYSQAKYEDYNYVRVLVRVTNPTSHINAYEMMLHSHDDCTFNLIKLTDTESTVVTDAVGGGGTCAAGDLMRLEVSGTTTTHLVMKFKGSSIGTYDDITSPLTTGSPGIAIYDNGATMDDWAGGDL